MSEPTDAVATQMPASMGAPSMFGNSTIGYIQGGNYYNIQGGATITNVPPQQPSSDAAISARIEEIVQYLEGLLVMPSEFRQIHEAIAEKRMLGTGEYFKSKEEVVSWFKALQNVFLWATGGPGAGKTFLAAALIEWLESLADQTPGMAIGFIYFRYTERQTNVWDVVLSLVIQLAQWSQGFPQVLEAIDAAFARHRKRKAKPSLPELVKLLNTIVKIIPRAFIIIDGLDEMKPEVQWLLIDILASLETRVLLTSRGLPLLEEKVKGLKGDQVTFVEVVAQAEDLELFIAGMIDRNPTLSKLLHLHKIKAEVIAAIKDQARGMFLYAALQVEQLQRCRNLRSIRDIMAQPPSRIEDLYAQTMKRILEEKDDAQLAQLVLLWLLHAKSPLTIEDLIYAVAVDPVTLEFDEDRIVSEEDILSVCHGLVTVDDQTRQARLIHLTAYHALLSLLSDHHPPAHEIFARVCINRLMSCGLQVSKAEHLGHLQQIYTPNPLLQYANNHAPYHVHEAYRTNPGLRDFVTRFALGCESYPFNPYFALRYVSELKPGVIQPEDEHVSWLQPIHVAAAFGLPALVIQLRDQGVDINLRAVSIHPEEEWTSLTIAIVVGDEEMVDLLLSFPEIETDDSTTATFNDAPPLVVASTYGRISAVKKLLQGTDINKSDPDGWTTLMMTAAAGQDVVLKELLNVPDVDVNLQTTDGLTALHLAAFAENDTVMKQLLAVPGINFNHSTTAGRSALMVAARRGHKNQVKLLLDMPGILVNAQDEQGRTVLMHAAKKGELDVISVLLGFPGLDVNKQDGDGLTALMHACRKQHLPVVDLLLKVPGIDLNRPTNTRDSNALFLSVETNQEAMVKILLSSTDLDLNIRDQHGRTAVMRAAYFGYTLILSMLLEDPRCDPCIRSASGETIILHALTYHFRLYHDISQHKEDLDPQPVIHTLLDHSEICDLAHLSDNEGYTPLIVASKLGYSSVVERLLTVPGVDVNATTVDGHSASKLAEENGHASIVEKLREAGATLAEGVAS